MSFEILFNGRRSDELGVLIESRPEIPAPKRAIESIAIPGKGIVHKDLGYYEDIDIKVKAAFITEADKWGQQFRKVKKWLSTIGMSELRFSDDVGYFRKVIKAEADSAERVLKRGGRFSINFLCDPYCYAINGKDTIPLPDQFQNSGEPCEPTYTIKGEGVCTLTVNQKSVKANIGGSIVLDTALKQARNAEGTAINTSVSGDLDDLKLKEGMNTFNLSTGFTAEIRTNWRCL